MRAVFAREGGEIAAVILEPIPANAGLYFARPGFLELLRELCTQHGALLIFDEVMTGFRVAKGGAQELYGITPDLTALGKVIGGGLPVGAFGGRAEIMDQLSPDGPVYQAGTLSGNPLAMAAGLAQLRELERTNAWRRLEELGAVFEDGRARGAEARRESVTRSTGSARCSACSSRRTRCSTSPPRRRATARRSRRIFTRVWTGACTSRRRSSRRGSSRPRTPPDERHGAQALRRYAVGAGTASTTGSPD